ncbi:MAG: antitoxin [Chloroflexi bacterium]|nr:antitoxin [Chloroflexota bacterium]
MTKRLQVLFEDDELAEIQQLARRRRQTTAAWVRDALRAARASAEYPDPEPKLRAVREAMAYDYPTGSIEDILGAITMGYADDHEDRSADREA